MLWQRILHKALFICPVSLLLRKELPNFPFIYHGAGGFDVRSLVVSLHEVFTPVHKQVGLIGTAPLGTEFSLDMNGVLISGKTVRGIIEGDSVPDNFIPRLIELHNQGRFPFDHLVEFYNLQGINRAAEGAEGGSALKPLLHMP